MIGPSTNNSAACNNSIARRAIIQPKTACNATGEKPFAIGIKIRHSLSSDRQSSEHLIQPPPRTKWSPLLCRWALTRGGEGGGNELGWLHTAYRERAITRAYVTRGHVAGFCSTGHRLRQQATFRGRASCSGAASG